MIATVCPSGPIATLNPRTNPFPPIFPLPPHLNPFVSRGVDIYPVPLYSSAVPNVKAFMARHLLEHAKRRDKLCGVHTLVEATSGNTGMALGILAPYYGVRRVVAVVERDIAPGKAEQLRLAGVDIEYPMEGKSTVETAKFLGEQKAWLNLNQYGNSANVEAHELFTGPHVWEQTHGKLTIFAAALGTTATAVGAKRFFLCKPGARDVYVLGAACAPESAVPGVRTIKKLKDISFDWQKVLDRVMEVKSLPAYKLSLQLFRVGVMAGPSSGLALAALIQLLADWEGSTNGLERFRNRDGRVVAAFVCGDTMQPYMEKYSMILNGSDLDPLRLPELY